MIVIPELQDLFEQKMFNTFNKELIRQKLDIIEDKYNNKFTIEFQYNLPNGQIEFDVLFHTVKDKEWYTLAWLQ